jgi:(S)-2-hydroxyglutarate dehydrogenase
MYNYDFLIIGGGIIGLFIAKELKHRFPDQSIAILEKEDEVSLHASGRNSGVLHAGFYYTADSFKAQFTRDGNAFLREYCRENKLSINNCGKLVVASNEQELNGLKELKSRGDKNGVKLEWISEQEAAEIDPNAMTYNHALFSETTATINPTEISHCLKRELIKKGVKFFFDTRFIDYKNSVVKTNNNDFCAGFIVNAAGLYADKIAHRFGFGKKYVLIPFKGLYLKYSGDTPPVRTNIYPVPNLSNPFLGVHFTITVDGSVKIGPTAIPAFWRENYKGLSNFKFNELVQTLRYESKLFLNNSFGFRNLACEEAKKYRKNYLVNLASKMTKKIDQRGFSTWTKPGIRAQLLDKNNLKLIQDFVFEGDKKSMHILNAVSPAFTSSYPIAKHIVDKISSSFTSKFD